MTLNEQLSGNFPKTFDRSSVNFSSLVTNQKGTAALQKSITNLLNYMTSWCATPDIYKQSGAMLKKTLTFFSFLEAFPDESETSIKNRFKAVFVRNHNNKWGTPFDVKSVFKQYFPSADIYLIENTNKIDDSVPEYANLFDDGDLDTSSTIAWDLSNCSISTEARFSKSYGILFDTVGGTLSQTVLIRNRKLKINSESEEEYKNIPYFLHFFLKGKLNVKIYNAANEKYWNFETKSWIDTPVENLFTSDYWDNKSLYFLTEGDDDVAEITITFSYVDTITYADYFRLFEKQDFGSFTVIAHFIGYSATGVFGLAPGEDDPNIETQEETPPQPRYGNYGYFDKSYLSGVPVGFAKDIYEDLLDYLRAQGVKAYLDIVIKDYIENETNNL